MAILEFRGQHYFLSNFYKEYMEYDGIVYGSSEAAFQAQKTLDERERLLFAQMTPGVAKKQGKHVKLRSDWEQVKLDVMTDVLYEKFTQSEYLKGLLLATGDEGLVEGNTWGDKYWGVCNGEGQNRLGRILMNVRRKIKEELRGE